MINTKFNIGDKVTCNGNADARVIAVHNWNGVMMYDVRLWDGYRLVGDVCVGADGIKLSEQAA